MNPAHLDLIRFALDGAICLACVVLLIHMGRRRWRQPAASRRSPDAVTELPRPHKDSAAPPPAAGNLRGEIIRLTRGGRSVAEIARITGLSQGEIALIQKFADQGKEPAGPLK